MFNIHKYTDRMSGEQFHAIDSPLSFSISELQLRLQPGEVKEGRFTVHAPEGRGVEGYVSSSVSCVQCLTERFAGAMDEITYRADASSLSDGEQTDGYFRIISTEGEYTIPFHIIVEKRQIRSSLGNIENLNHFTNLARASWREAAVLFYDREFPSLLQDKKSRGLYRGLSAVPGNEQNVEEFLISLGEKQPVEYQADTVRIKQEISAGLLETPEEKVEYSLRITRNGWGYTRLALSCNGDFLSFSKEMLTEEDFIGNSVRIACTVDPSALHAGKNHAEIRLQSPFSEERIPVEIHFRTGTGNRSLYRREKMELTVGMVKDFEEFRARRLSGKEWLERVRKSADRLGTLDRNDPFPLLYEVHAAITEGDIRNAVLLLRKINRRYIGGELSGDFEFSAASFEQEDPTAYCYRIYLTSLCSEENTDFAEYVAERIEHRYKRDPSNWRIAWLYMYTSMDFMNRPELKLQMLQRLWKGGCTSPVLYIEAYSEFMGNPALLTELDGFTLQVLFYAARKKILTDSVLMQINYLSGRQRTFSEKIYRILSMGVETTQVHAVKKELIESICGLLIKGNQTDSMYFPWYRRGIEEELQITRLFEYYMLSLPEDFDGELPRMVLMYFAYRSTLPYEKNAYLYRYVFSHRNEQPELFMQYEQQITDFTLEQLQQQRINRDLAFLYDVFLHSRVLDQETVNRAVPVIFSCVLHTTHTSMKQVILQYDHSRREEVYPVEDGVCYFPVYGKDNHIFFADRDGNRYAESAAYAVDRMMDYEGLEEILSYYAAEQYGYRLFCADAFVPGRENADARGVQELVLSGDLETLYRQKMTLKLLEHYRKQDDLKSLRTFLKELQYEDFTAPARSRVLEYMVQADLCRKALSWVRRGGHAGVEDGVLFRLCSRLLQEEAATDNEEFAELVLESYRRKKYDARMLVCLSEELNGTMEELEQIRHSMQNFDLNIYDLLERMFHQMLYSGTVPEELGEMLDLFRREGDDPRLVSRILAQCSHEFLTVGRYLPETVFDCIGIYGRAGYPLLDGCRIAYLKMLSERSGEIAEQEQEISRVFLTDLLQGGIVFPFYRQFLGFIPELQAYADETLVEYDDPHHPGRHIVYHYALEENGRSGSFMTRDMKEMYEGMYVAGFTLFFGEQMHYFITDDPEEKNIVESGTIGQDARIIQQEEDRFGRINRIARLEALKQNGEARKAVGEYDHLAFMVSRLLPNEKG